MVYLLKMVIFHGELLNNQMVNPPFLGIPWSSQIIRTGRYSPEPMMKHHMEAELTILREYTGDNNQQNNFWEISWENNQQTYFFSSKNQHNQQELSDLPHRFEASLLSDWRKWPGGWWDHHGFYQLAEKSGKLAENCVLDETRFGYIRVTTWRC